MNQMNQKQKQQAHARAINLSNTREYIKLLGLVLDKLEASTVGSKEESVLRGDYMVLVTAFHLNTVYQHSNIEVPKPITDYIAEQVTPVLVKHGMHVMPGLVSNMESN